MSEYALEWYGFTTDGQLITDGLVPVRAEPLFLPYRINFYGGWNRGFDEIVGDVMDDIESCAPKNATGFTARGNHGLGQIIVQYCREFKS